MKRETDEWVWRRSVSERPNVLMDDNRTCVRGGVHVWMYIRFHFPFFFWPRFPFFLCSSILPGMRSRPREGY